jgi:hypothetical protein
LENSVKRTALVATLALVALSPAAAFAGAGGGSRAISATYSAFGGATTPAAAFNAFNVTCQTPGVGDCFDFSTVKGEKTVVITAKDGSGTPVGLQVFTDGDFQTQTGYCGTATLTVSPKIATQVSVRVVASTDCAALPTSGTLTAVISKK